MKNLFCCFLFFFVISNVLISQCSLKKTGWTEVFVEDFTKPNILDYTTDWRFETYVQKDCLGSPVLGTPNQKIDPNNIFHTLGEDGMGELNFTAKVLDQAVNCNDGREARLSASWMGSTHDDFPDHSMSPNGWCNLEGDFASEGGFLYGMFEIECKLSTTSGMLNAFWLLGNNAHPTEIDAFEYWPEQPNSALASVYFLDNGVTSCGNSLVYPYYLSDEYHTWTVVWTPTKITWFLDGKEIKSDSDPSHNPTIGFSGANLHSMCKYRKADMIIQASQHQPWGSPGDVSDPLKVRSVKVYKPSGLLSWEEWLAQNGLSTGSQSDFHDYYNNELFPAYETTSYKPENDWNLSTVATFENNSTTDINNYNCLSDLNVINDGNDFVFRGEGDHLWKIERTNTGHYTSSSLSNEHIVDGDVESSRGDLTFFYRHNYELKYYEGGQFHEALLYSFNIPVICPESTPQQKWCWVPVSAPVTLKDNLTPKRNGMEVYYRGLDDNVYIAKRSDLSSEIWSVTALTDNNDCYGTIVLDPSDESILYYQTNAGHIRQLNLFGTTVSSNTIISTIDDVAGSIKISFDKKVYYRTTENKLSYYSRESGSWTHSPVMAINPHNSQIEHVGGVKSNINIHSSNKIFYVGLDNRVWNIYSNNGGILNIAAPLNWEVTYIRDDLQFSSESNSFPLACVGSDNKIRLWNWGECEISGLPCSGNSSNIYRDKGKENHIIRENDVKNLYKSSIYPNPSNSDWIKLNLPVNTTPNKNPYLPSEEINVTFFNIQGVIAKQITIPAGGTHELNIEYLPKGHYFVRIKSNSFEETLKFVKI